MTYVKFILELFRNLLRSVAGVLHQVTRRLARARRRPSTAHEISETRWKLPGICVSAQQRQRILLTGAVIVMFGSAVCIYIASAPEPTTHADIAGQQLALGRGVAEETLKLLADGGQVVAVAWESGDEADEFRKVIRASDKAKLRGMERIRPSQVQAETLRLTGEFPKILEKYPAVDVIVSFVGLPDMSDEELAKAGSRLPKFVIVTGATSGLELFIERKLLTVAIVPRGVYYGPTPEEDRPLTPQELFNQQYRVIGTGTMANR